MPQINEISAKYHEGIEKLKKEKLKKTDDLLKEYKIKFETIDEEYETNLVETKNFYISEIDKLKGKKEESQEAIPIIIKTHEESSLNLIKDFDKKMKLEKERVKIEDQSRKNKVQLNKDKDMHKINKSNDEKMSDLNKKISNIETIINGVKENTKISNEEERKKDLEIKDSKLDNLKKEYNSSIDKLNKDNITKNNNYITEFESNKEKVIDSLEEKEEKDKKLEEDKNKKISDKKLEVESQINIKYIEEINDVQSKFNKLNEDYKNEIDSKSKIYDYLKTKDIENQSNFITLSSEYDENFKLLNTLDLNLKEFLKNNEKALKYKSEKELLKDILEQKTDEIKNSDFKDIDKFIEESINKIVIDNDEKTKKTKKELDEIKGLIEVYNNKLESREKTINENIVTLDSEKIKIKEEFDNLHKKINTTDGKELEKIKNKMISDEKERLNKEKEKELSNSKSNFENDISNLDKKFKEIKNNLKQNIEENQQSISTLSLELNNKNFEISSLDQDFESFKKNININEDSELNKKLLEINKERDTEIEKSKISVKSVVEKELESDKIKKEVEKKNLLETYNLQKLKINEMDSIYYKQSSELSSKIDLLEKEITSMDEVIKSKSIKISDYKDNFDKYTSEIRERNRKDYTTEKEMLKKTISGKKYEYDVKVSKVQAEIKELDKDKADYLIILTGAELNHEAKAFILSSINEIDNKISFKNAEIDAITQEYSSKINEVNLVEGLNKKFIEADSKVDDIVNNQIKDLEENKKELEFNKQKNNIEILKSKDEIKVLDEKSKEYQEKLLEGMKTELEKNTESVENQYLTKYQKKYSEEFSKKSKEINQNFDILIKEQKTIELNNKIDTYKLSYLEKKNKINAEKADLESKTSDKIITIPKLQLQLDNIDSDRISENEKIISHFNDNIKGIEEKYINLEKQNISDINNNYDNTQLLENLSEIELEIFNIEDKISSYNISLKNISKEKVENNLIYRKQDLDSIITSSNEEMIKSIETIKSSKKSMIENLILIETSKIEEEFNNNKIKLDSLYKNTLDKINNQTTTINKLKELEEKSRKEIEETKMNIDKIKLELYDVEQFLDSSKLEFQKNKKNLDTELIQLNENMKNDLEKKLENEIKKIEEDFSIKPMTTEFNPEKIISEFEKIKLEKINKNNKTHQIEIKNLEIEYEDNVKKAIDVYNFSLNESYENLISKISDLEKNLVPDLEKLVEERKVVIDLHEGNIRGINTKYDKEFKTLEGIYEEDIKKVIKDVNLEEALEGKKLNTKFLENMSRLEIDYDSKIIKLKDESKNKFIDMEEEYKQNHIKNKENYYYFKELEMDTLKNELKELENVYKNEIMV